MNGKEAMDNRDDQISAYLDGAMSAQEARAFEAEMECDPALAEAVMRLRGNDDLLKTAFDAPIHAPIGADMLERFGLAGSPPASNIVDFAVAREARVERTRARELMQHWRWPLAGALAASLVAVVTVGTQWTGSQPFDLESSKAFQVAMQDLPSTTRTKLEDGRDVSSTLSFAAGDGRYCREFVLDGGSHSQSGIACRGIRDWSVEALVKGANTVPDGTEIRAAAGVDGLSLDSAYRRLNASDPVDSTLEKDLISKGWVK